VNSSRLKVVVLRAQDVFRLAEVRGGFKGQGIRIEAMA
jgi:hypothetical protein